MLKNIRRLLACISLLCVTLLFVDFTGSAHRWFGWLARIQLLPALLALNVGVVVALLVVTLLFGRVYCSIICPLGVMQDVAAHFGKRAKRYRYTYSRPLNWLRYTMLAVMALAVILGIGSVVALLAPYGAYGRIAQSILAPVVQLINNALADYAARVDSYAFYHVDIWIRNVAVFAIALATLIVLTLLAWRNGRTYCNTVCPVGTVLGFLSRFSLFAPVVDMRKCNSCGLCARNCKSSCIDSKKHRIDYSRCVGCMDCLSECRKGAIKYTYRYAGAGKDEIKKSEVAPDMQSRRDFLAVAAALGTVAAADAQKKVDGGLAVIVDKLMPERKTKIAPAGAGSLRNFSRSCTACQLCVAACDNQVLRPSNAIENFMQPVVSYERGYCRPECVKCSQVCPAGAIKPISVEDKSAIQVGHAVWIKKNCVPLTDGVECGNCARHCPVGAITMVNSDPKNVDSVKIPVVNTERCIGCGACENLCPSRPFSAIYVEGHENHRSI